MQPTQTWAAALTLAGIDEACMSPSACLKLQPTLAGRMHAGSTKATFSSVLPAGAALGPPGVQASGRRLMA